MTDHERRLIVADRIKQLDDVSFPHLDAWNYNACTKHAALGMEPQVSCEFRACGGDLFSHQRVGAAWLYSICHGLLADDPGVGKTSQILWLLSLLKQLGELNHRAVIIPSTPAVKQWGEEFTRWAPGLKVIVLKGTIPASERLEQYATDWDVLVIGSHIAINDLEVIERLAPFDLVVSDDVDALLSHSNATHRAIKAISKDAKYSFTVNATTLQIRLEQLHAAFEPIKGNDTFGNLKQFQAHHIREELVTEWENGKQKQRRKRTGFKNIPELQDKVRSLYLRRKATELTDIRMPELMPPVIEWFELSPQQRALYAELQQGVLTLIKEEGTKVKHLNALTKYMYGQQICAGLPALNLPDGPGASPKLDRLFHNLNGVWADRKTLVYVKNIGMVKAALTRAREQGINCAMVWGEKQNADQRSEQITKFWEDPTCRFLIGTTAMERSLNLQCANTVVAIDTQLNPARMKQLLGRIKRAGSAHDRVFFFTYLTRDTQEERYMQVLAERQAISDTVFEEESEMYERLSPLELLSLMGTYK